MLKKELSMTRRSFAFLIAVTAFLLASFAANAQCPASILATDLKAPTKIIFSTTSNLLVAEQGNGPNTGRISIIDKISGAAPEVIANCLITPTSMAQEP